MKCPKCETINPADSKYCKECATRLDLAGQASVTRTLETTTGELTRGTTFAGRYEIIEELGTGGMGRVYRAHDTKLNEEVALKLIKPEIAAEKRVVERFRNELKTARKIRHKNVCGMYDFHEEGKTLYLTMEYVRGEDLKSFIHRSKALTIGAALSIARQVAEGLSEAHKLGIVHRDLKPGNIMIDKDGDAKIMDFGIARAREGKGITGEGAVIGTPEYMSPEQVEGKGADARSDIYALGVILFEILVGRAPFEGDTPFSIANKHRSEPPPVPKKLVPQIPEGLNKLILRCLEKETAKRYQTAEELIADLSVVEQALPLTEKALVRARTKTPPSREITVRLTPQKLILPAGVIITLATAIVAALIIFKPQPKKIDSLAVLPLDDLSAKKGECYSVDGIHDALINELTKIPAVNVIARQSVLRYKDSKKTIPEIARELNVAGIVEGSVVQAKNTVRINVSLFDGRDGKRLWGPKAFDRDPTDILSLYGEVTLEIAREIDAKLVAQNIENLTRRSKVKPEAYNLYYQALFGEWWAKTTSQEMYLKKKLDFLQQAVEIDPNFALGHAWIAMSLRDLSVFGFFLPQSLGYEKAKQSAQKAVSLDESLPEAHEALGLIKFECWDFVGAEKEYRRTIDLAPGRVAGALNIYLTMTGRFDEALAIQQHQNELNPLYPRSPVWTLYEAKRFEDGIAAANKELEINPNDLSERKIRSNCYAFRNMCAEAIAESQKILSEEPSAQSDADTLCCLALNYAHCGDRKKAEELIEALKKLKYIDEDPSMLAGIYAQLGEKDLAMAALRKGFESHSPLMALLKVEPMFDPLRSDPRFIALLRKIGFEK